MVTSLSQLPDARVVLFDLGPSAAVSLLGARVAPRVAPRHRSLPLRRGSLQGRLRAAASPCRGPPPRLAAPAPCTSVARCARSPRASRTSPMASASSRPFVLVSQPTVCDPTRAPRACTRCGRTATCRPAPRSTRRRRSKRRSRGSLPGFRDVVIARSVRTTADLEASNPNLVGGDIAGGCARRPAARRPTAAHAAALPRSPRARTCARRRRRRVPASTACAATTRRTPPCATSSAETLDRAC